MSQLNTVLPSKHVLQAADLSQNEVSISGDASRTGVGPLEYLRLGDVLERVSKPVSPVPNGTYREIGIRPHGKGIFHKEPINGSALGDKRVFRVEPGCLVLNIVFAWEQAVALTSQAEQGMIASHRFPMYRAKGGVDLRFLLHFFKTREGRNLLAIASPGGAGRNKTLNQEDFEDIHFTAPPLPEQCRIANAFDVWDRAIAATEALIAAKRSIKSHLLRTIFGPAINPNTEMPWAWTPLDVSELARVVGGGTPDTGESSYWGGPIPWCTPTDLAARTSRFIGKTERTITQKGLASSSAEVLPANIVILCSRASVGECAINTIPMATNQGFQSLVPKNKDDTHFLIYLVQSIKPRLLRISAGSTFQEFSRSELRSLTVAAPDEKRRKQIGKAFALIDGEIEYLMNSLSVYRTQKRGLMQKLLTGEWRLNGDEVQANKLARAAS